MAIREMLVEAKVEGVALMGGGNCRLKVRIGNEDKDRRGKKEDKTEGKTKEKREY